ncbi:MAG: PQQ-dependent sugar dehydrogenase [Bacteriovoracaceae bacterium]|nr:PQQ-dependent sugar dehydrogenase [Bacteriovoracaceae bacterium]
MILRGMAISWLIFLSFFNLYANTITITTDKLKNTKLLSNLAKPWAFDFLNPKEIIMTLKKGKLIKINLKNNKQTPIEGLPKVRSIGQGGLLDVKVAPDYYTSHKIFITYSKKVDKGVTTALISGILNKNKLTMIKELFVAKTISTKGQHFGSRITFDNKYIYISIGDRGYRHRAQMLDYHNGKIIRLNLDGTVPKDNPFYKTKNALPEIYSYGHRNPQGLFFDKFSKKLWNGEHGPRGGDEVNLITAGKNYGWPVITYGKEYYGPSIGEGTKRPGMEQPEYYFVPSIAPSDLLIYSGKLFKSLKGHIFQGALKLRHINVLIKQPNGKYEETRIVQNIGRVRSIRENELGEIYFATDSGQLYRLTKSFKDSK